MPDRIVLAEIRTSDTGIDMGELARMVGDDLCGAVVTFAGVVRGEEDGHPIDGLLYEHHEVLAGVALRRVLESAVAAHPVKRVACVHRVGMVPAGAASVGIAVAAPHRREAFDACQFIIDEMKCRVPIWKRPVTGIQTGGSRHEP